jgi:hypothetical protein
MPCYGEMLTLLSCFKARGASRGSSCTRSVLSVALACACCSALGAAPRRLARPRARADVRTRASAGAQKGNFDDAKCAGEVRALNECMALQAKKPKEMNTVNYHLNRLSSAAKR